MLILTFLMIVTNLHLIFSDSTDDSCTKYRSPDDVDLNKILGKWRIAEMIFHNIQKSDFGGQIIILTRPILEIQKADENGSFYFIQRDNNHIEPDIKRKIIRDASSGILKMLPSEEEKKNNVKVNTVIIDVIDIPSTNLLKVFTFCEGDSVFSSYLLANENYKPQPKLIRDVHNFLKKRGLNIGVVKTFVSIRNPHNVLLKHWIDRDSKFARTSWEYYLTRPLEESAESTEPGSDLERTPADSDLTPTDANTEADSDFMPTPTPYYTYPKSEYAYDAAMIKFQPLLILNFICFILIFAFY